jgi:hypothetical protein
VCTKRTVPCCLPCLSKSHDACRLAAQHWGRLTPQHGNALCKVLVWRLKAFKAFYMCLFSHPVPEMSKPAPFTSILLLSGPAGHSTGNTNTNPTTASQLLPASYKTQDGILQVPGACVEYLRHELGVDRLNTIHPWLWTAGRPMPPRALHHQKLLDREIFVSERMDMHLVWTKARIFIKPLPCFLLEPQFWVDHLSCRDRCECCQHHTGRSGKCEEFRLRECALGFLLSYVALISHESDFFIAKDTRLISDQISWTRWKTFVKEVLDHASIYEHINQRYVYGELRLNRLNAIYRLTGRAVFRGYQLEYSQYSSFFRDNFAWLASVLAYMAIVLTAMQVGLATRALGDDKTFQAVSYGFTVFTMVGSLAAMVTVFAVFVFVFIYHWIQTAKCVKARQAGLQKRTKGT